MCLKHRSQRVLESDRRRPPGVGDLFSFDSVSGDADYACIMKPRLRQASFLFQLLLIVSACLGTAAARIQLAGADSTVALGADLTVHQLDTGY